MIGKVLASPHCVPSRPFLLTGGGLGTFVTAKEGVVRWLGSGKVVVAFPHCLLYRLFLLTGGGSGTFVSAKKRVVRWLGSGKVVV